MRNLLIVSINSSLLFLFLFLAGCNPNRAVPLEPAGTLPPPSSSPTAADLVITETPAHAPATKDLPVPAETAVVSASSSQPVTCSLTPPDMLGPFYTPGAPQREKVGDGYVLSGVVRSTIDCQPVAGALIEFWLAGPNGEYSDDYRASMFSGPDGTYRFESDFPPPYSGRPSHIHIKVSAAGYETLVTQHYPVAGDKQAELDLVLQSTP